MAKPSPYALRKMVECRKVKSWLKSVSVFADKDDGSLFHGVNDDRTVMEPENLQAAAGFISETIKAGLGAVPEVQLIPIGHKGHSLPEVKVKAGARTSYYYRDVTRLYKSGQ
ncbi:MAG: ATP-binding protein [Clostridium sp.]|nr:ATP-binding protein [Clostridium sp.]